MSECAYAVAGMVLVSTSLTSPVVSFLETACKYMLISTGYAFQFCLLPRSGLSVRILTLCLPSERWRHGLVRQAWLQCAG